MHHELSNLDIVNEAIDFRQQRCALAIARRQSLPNRVISLFQSVALSNLSLSLSIPRSFSCALHCQPATVIAIRHSKATRKSISRWCMRAQWEREIRANSIFGYPLRWAQFNTIVCKFHQLQCVLGKRAINFNSKLPYFWRDGKTGIENTWNTFVAKKSGEKYSMCSFINKYFI